MWKHDLRDVLRLLYDRLNRLLEEVLLREQGSLMVDPETEVPWEPPMDVYETPDTYVVEAEVGGVDRASLEVGVEGDRLWIRGSRRLTPAGEGQEYHRIEIPVGPFVRYVSLPEGADLDRLEAVYRDGVLVVRIPRRLPGCREVPVD